MLGRLVPIEDGLILEGAPLVVPRAVAEQVAAAPDSWIEAIREAPGEIETGGFEVGLGHDVPGPIWELMLHDPGEPVPDVAEFGTYFARRALNVARECLEDERLPDPDQVDIWACLRAAFLSMSVVLRLPEVAESEDVEVLERLTGVLASPADVVCRDLLAITRAGR